MAFVARPRPITELLFEIAKRRVRRRKTASVEVASEDGYDAWRRATLDETFRENFDERMIVGKDVLDFGCGTGDLSILAKQWGAATVIATDLDDHRLARGRLAATAAGVEIDFHLAINAETITLPDSCIDIILSFASLEHIINYESIVSEWRRVLRPAGRILIWWSPYFHPYGHHLQSYAPIPWMHVFVSDETMARVCAKIVSLDDFAPPYWDLDANGKKRNRFLNVRPGTRFASLNRLTIAQFERSCRQRGLILARREFNTFKALRRWPAAGWFLTLPGLRELFTSYAVYEIITAHAEPGNTQA